MSNCDNCPSKEGCTSQEDCTIENNPNNHIGRVIGVMSGKEALVNQELASVYKNGLDNFSKQVLKSFNDIADRIEK